MLLCEASKHFGCGYFSLGMWFYNHSFQIICHSYVFVGKMGWRVVYWLDNSQQARTFQRLFCLHFHWSLSANPLLRIRPKFNLMEKTLTLILLYNSYHPSNGSDKHRQYFDLMRKCFYNQFKFTTTNLNILGFLMMCKSNQTARGSTLRMMARCFIGET